MRKSSSKRRLRSGLEQVHESSKPQLGFLTGFTWSVGHVEFPPESNMWKQSDSGSQHLTGAMVHDRSLDLDQLIDLEFGSVYNLNCKDCGRWSFLQNLCEYLDEVWKAGTTLKVRIQKDLEKWAIGNQRQHEASVCPSLWVDQMWSSLQNQQSTAQWKSGSKRSLRNDSEVQFGSVWPCTGNLGFR